MDCSLELPGVNRAPAGTTVELTIQFGAPAVLMEPEVPGLTRILRGGDCSVDYGPFARFTITADGSYVHVTPGAGVGTSMLRHIVIDHVIPRRFALIGRVALHATAIDVGNGAVAFMGVSGRGKSTLSAALVAAGGNWVADDFLLLDTTGAEISVVPTIVATRLCEDSASALGLLHRDAEVIFTGAAKRRWTVIGADGPVPLRALVVLDRRTDADGPVTCSRLGPGESLAEIAPQWFLAETGAVSPATMLRTLGSVLQEVPVIRLSYPTSLDRLNNVVSAVHAIVGQIHPMLVGAVSASVAACAIAPAPVLSFAAWKGGET